MPDLTDAEVICNYMEPKPELGWRTLPVPLPEWWYWESDLGPGFADWHHRTLDLDALYEVEQKLMDGDITTVKIAAKYIKCADGYPAWHLTAAQKVEALATVIRGIK